MSPGPGDLSNLAKAAIDFAIAVFVLALIATFILQAMLEIGLRTLINRWLVIRFLDIGSSYFRTQSIFNLPYRQLCGQFAATINIDLAAGEKTPLLLSLADTSKFKSFTGSDKNKMAGLQAVGFSAQQGIDELQEHLGTWWIRINYVIAILIIGITVFVLIYTPNAFDPMARLEEWTASRFMLIAVGGIAALVVPLGQRLLERVVAR
jgi:hypothetical protein